MSQPPISLVETRERTTAQRAWAGQDCGALTVAPNEPPPAGNYYQIGGRGASATSPAKTLCPVRVVSAFPGRIRLQTSGGRCRGDGRLREFAARLALLPGVCKAEVVPDANSIIVRFAAPERDLAAVLADIEAMTAAPRPVAEPLEGAERPAGPGSGDLCALVEPVLKRLPAYVRLGWALAKEPAIPWRHKTLLCLFPLYCVSPVNLLAQSIPVLGLVDEAVWFLVGTRQALAHCPPPVAARHLARLHLAPRQLQEDVNAVLAVVGRVAGRVLGLGAPGRRPLVDDAASARREPVTEPRLVPPAARPARAAPIPGGPLRIKGPNRRPPHARSRGGLEPTRVLHAAW